MLSNQVIEYAKSVYEKLVSSKAMSKKDIEKLLSPNNDVYDQVKSMLSNTEYVITRSGYHGGLAIDPAIDKPPTTVSPDDLRKISEALQGPNQDADEKEKERELYKPLQSYLEKSNSFDVVDIGAKLQGEKWQNADLVAISYQKELHYHSGIELDVTAFEVKKGMVDPPMVQQAASYLPYSNASYLCYVHKGDNPKKPDEIRKSLAISGIWSLVEIAGIGLIVAYKPTIKSPSHQFQIVRQAPYSFKRPSELEQGIELWADEDTKEKIKKMANKQIVKIMGY